MRGYWTSSIEKLKSQCMCVHVCMRVCGGGRVGVGMGGREIELRNVLYYGPLCSISSHVHNNAVG